jgi:hypothetical protein
MACIVQSFGRIRAIPLLAAALLLSGVTATQAQAYLKKDTAKEARNWYSSVSIAQADDSTPYHNATSSAKKGGLRRRSSNSFKGWEEWDFQKDGTNEPAFSCSVHYTLKGDSSKVTITLQPTNNWCPGFPMKAVYDPTPAS